MSSRVVDVRRSLLAGLLTVAFIAAPFPVAADVPFNTQIVPGDRAIVGAVTQSLGFDVGRLEIPAIGIEERIREGVDIGIINRGPAHWAGTAMPGREGNMVLAGHRTTYSRPFHDLDRLAVGDDIWVTGIDGVRAHYVVKHTMIVHPSAVWIADWTRQPTLTLFACHPKGSLAQRIVVRAELAHDPVDFPS